MWLCSLPQDRTDVKKAGDGYRSATIPPDYLYIAAVTVSASRTRRLPSLPKQVCTAAQRLHVAAVSIRRACQAGKIDRLANDMHRAPVDARVPVVPATSTWLVVGIMQCTARYPQVTN